MPPKQRGRKPAEKPTSVAASSDAQQRTENHPYGDGSPVIVVDCGASHVKLVVLSDGRVTHTAIVPNCVALRSGYDSTTGQRRTVPMVGSQLMDLSEGYRGIVIRRPLQNGHLSDGRLQAAVLDRVFAEAGLVNVGDVAGAHLIVTVAPSAPQQVAEVWYSSLAHLKESPRSVAFVTSPWLSLIASEGLIPVNEKNKDGVIVLRGTGIVLDAGFSSSTATPFVGFKPQRRLIRRVDVGGKLLTNRLKEHVSYTQLNVLEETWLLNIVKETVARVSLRFESEMAAASRKLSAGAEGAASESDEESVEGAAANGTTQLMYVLPTTPATLPFGYPADVRTPAARRRARKDARGEPIQGLLLKHEVFAVPEALFCPRDVGLAQAGVAEAVAQAAGYCEETDALTPAAVSEALLSNLVLAGGTANIPGFVPRLRREVQSMSCPPTLTFKASGAVDEERVASEQQLAIDDLAATSLHSSESASPIKAKRHLLGLLRCNPNFTAEGDELPSTKVDNELHHTLLPIVGSVRLFTKAEPTVRDELLKMLWEAGGVVDGSVSGCVRACQGAL